MIPFIPLSPEPEEPLLDREWLTNVLSNNETTQADRLMVVLLDSDESKMFEPQIKKVCKSHGLDASTWDFSSILGPAKKQGFVAYIQTKWQLTDKGRDSLKEKGLMPPQKTPLTQTSLDLRTHLSSIQNPEAKTFVEDAILCLEAKALRPAIVMSWLGAVMVLRDHVIGDPTRLSEFNKKAQARKKPWEDARTTDDLSTISDNDLLELLEDSHIITPDIRRALKQCLDQRNRCAHPNSFRIGEQQVAAHIETLILNVYAKFATVSVPEA